MYTFTLLYLFIYLNPSVYASNSNSNLTLKGLLEPPCSHVCNCFLQPWETCSQYPPCSYLSALYTCVEPISQVCSSQSLALQPHWPHQSQSPCPSHKEGVCVCAKSLQSYLTLCDPVGYSSPCSSVHTFLQARILEWAAVPSSRGSSWPKDGTHVSWCPLHWHAGSLPLAPPGKLAGTLGWTSSLTSWGFILFYFYLFFSHLFLSIGD